MEVYAVPDIYSYLAPYNFILHSSPAASIEETNSLGAIKIYPNPTTSFINIVGENNQLKNSTTQIKNYLGEIIYSGPFDSQINISELSAGIYFLSIQNGHSSKTFKIIKN